MFCAVEFGKINPAQVFRKDSVKGMGTQIQSKRYSTGYCAILGLQENAKHNIWSSYHEDKPKKNGHCESLLPWRVKPEGFLAYDKETVRQTILKHESTFRHQLQELHRLYGRQRELMNVFRRDVNHGQIKEEALSLSPFIARNSSEDAKCTWQISHAPSSHLVPGKSSVLEFSGKQSSTGFSKENNVIAFLSGDDGISKIREASGSKGTLFEKKIFDLEIPADAYMNNEETYSEETCSELPRFESTSTRSTQEILYGRGVKKSCSAPNDNENGTASKSSLLLKRKDKLVDLNEPILLEDTSDSGSFGNPGYLSSGNWGNMQSDFVAATPNSVLNPLWKDTSLTSKKEMIGGTCFRSLQSTNKISREAQLTNNLKAKQMHQDSLSMIKDACSRDSCVAFQSSQAEQKKISQLSESGQCKTERPVKRKLFGVDIFEVNDESMVTETSVVHRSNKFDELGYKRSVLHVDFSSDSSTRSLPRSIDGVSHQNGVSLCSQLDERCTQYDSIPDFTNSIAVFDSLTQESASRDLAKPVQHLDCLDEKSAKASKIAMKTSDVFQDDFAAGRTILTAHCQSKQKISEGARLGVMGNVHCSDQAKNNFHLNLDSLQNSSQQFFKNGTSLSSERSIRKLENSDCVLIPDNDDGNTDSHLCCPTKMEKDFPSSGKHPISKDLNFTGNVSEPLADGGDNTGDVSLEKVASGDLPGGKGFNLEKQINDPISSLRCHIDLNLSLVEDEDPSTPSRLPTAVVKLAETELDLEVPMFQESETDKHIEVPSIGSKEPDEEISRLAAEALVAISVSGAEDVLYDAMGGSMEDKLHDCLRWFVNAASSFEFHDPSKIIDVESVRNGGFLEDLIPDGMDYFEYMTLKLEDNKSDEYLHNYSAPQIENQDDDEEAKDSTLSRRPRRGQARRGRQRKDFQRDVLPSLISLSKLEMTEDFQTFEELLRASGVTWQSSFSRRLAAKSSRGRRRSRTMPLPPTQQTEAVSPLREQKSACREVQLGDKTLTGWGKRTRRLPRQRCMTGTTTFV